MRKKPSRPSKRRHPDKFDGIECRLSDIFKQLQVLTEQMHDLIKLVQKSHKEKPVFGWKIQLKKKEK